MKFCFLRQNDWNLLFIRFSCIFSPEKQTCVKKEMSVRTLAALWSDMVGWFSSACIWVFCLQVFATTDRSKKHKVRITSCITTVLQCLEILIESISSKVWIWLYMKQNASIQQKLNYRKKLCPYPLPPPLPLSCLQENCFFRMWICDCIDLQLAQSIKDGYDRKRRTVLWLMLHCDFVLLITSSKYRLISVHSKHVMHENTHFHLVQN